MKSETEESMWRELFEKFLRVTENGPAAAEGLIRGLAEVCFVVQVLFIWYVYVLK